MNGSERAVREANPFGYMFYKELNKVYKEAKTSPFEFSCEEKLVKGRLTKAQKKGNRNPRVGGVYV